MDKYDMKISILCGTYIIRGRNTIFYNYWFLSHLAMFKNNLFMSLHSGITVNRL